MNPAYCIVAQAPLRSEASDRSEMVSQLLFGEPVEIIETTEKWVRLSTWFDQYEGWTDRRLVKSLSSKELKRWLDGLDQLKIASIEISGPLGKQTVFKGAYVPIQFEKGFNVGNDAFELSATSSDQDPQSEEAFALSYLNTPYLWGGKSMNGIDCSGYVQQLFRFSGKQLPRDAWQQQEHGETILFEEAQAGDLAFFANDSGKITHVGYLLTPDKIIHASGWVRIDKFTSEGIMVESDGELTHRFHSIKRI